MQFISALIPSEVILERTAFATPCAFQAFSIFTCMRSNMKLILYVSLMFFLSGCALSPERKEAIRIHEEIADAAEERARTHETLPGTPENMEGIEVAKEQARKNRALAREMKKNPFSNLFGAVFDAIFDRR